MTRSVAEANIAISRIRDMPYGIARSTASAAELDRITAEGPPEARAYALFTTVEGYAWGGEVDKAFLPFTQMLRWWDAHPEYFDEQDQHSLFWSFKWMVAHLMEFPAITAAQIDTTLTDMQRRYALAGNGMNAVALSRFGWAQMRGAADTEDLFVEWSSTPRDDFSQCEACDPGDRAAHLYRTGRYEECIRLVEQVLPQSPECATEPGDMLSYLQLASLHVGDAVGAARAHRLARQHLPQDVTAAPIRGRHLEFLARSGNPSRALAKLVEDQRFLLEGDTPHVRWTYLRSVGAATGLLAADHAATPIELHGVPAATVAELDRWVRGEALTLAAAFDARNQTSALTDATWAVWNDATFLPVDLSVFGEHLAPVASAAPAPRAEDPAQPSRPQASSPDAFPAGADADAAQGQLGLDDPAELLAWAESQAGADRVAAARAYVAAANAYRAVGRLQAAGFAHAEAAMLASAEGDDEGARAQFASAASLLRGAATPARFFAPVVRAWARRAEVTQLPEIDRLAESLIGELSEEELPDGLSDDILERERAARAVQARRLADTRVRVAATLGDPTAPERAETIAEEFARAGEYADAAYAFWLLGMLRTDDVDAVYALESATEAFTLAHLQEPRREVGGELVAVLKRLGRADEAEKWAVELSGNA